MSGTNRPVTEDDLHAYVDRRLDAERTLVVEHHVRDNPSDAARVAAYRAQRTALRGALAEHAGERVPPRLDPRVLLMQRQSVRGMLWRAAAAIVLAFGVGGGAGWVLRGQLTPPTNDIASLVREAMANHIIYTADRRRPTELGADQRDDLARWVSNRLNHPVAPPDLSDSGFKYIGGRLAATPEGPAGLFMYQNDAGIRLTVFVRPDRKADNTPLVPIDAKPVGGAAWIDKGVGYTVLAPVPSDELRRLAEQVQRRLEPRA